MDEFLEYLVQEKEQKFPFENQNHLELVNRCLSYIGDEDSTTRDHIIYPALAHLLHDHHLTTEQLVSITQQLLSSDYLLYDMENTETWSVLKRSFTVLQLVILVFVHNRDNVFSTEEVTSLYDTVMSYFTNETVLTGYDETVGWAHAIAHSGDLFAQLVDCKELSNQQILDIWYAVSDKFVVDHYIYISDEDERLVNMMEKSIKAKQLSDQEIIDWITYTSDKPLPNTFPQRYYMKQNKQHLLRSLYFRIDVDQVGKEVLETLFKASMNKQ